jgi:predicted molibdopterin-dependent oxidoreductase YjgC
MFRRLREPTAPVRLTVDGRPVAAAPTDSVAAALLAAGSLTFRRSPMSGAARGPYCGMGVCFDCLVTIDGAPNQQACLTAVRDGMTVETGGARPALKAP